MINLELSSQPFKHASTAVAIDAAVADKILEAIKEFRLWARAESSHYRNALCHFTPDDVPNSLSGLITPELTSEVRRAVEQAFCVDLAPEARMMLNRFESGEGTLIHNDYMEDRDHAYFFTHRALLYLNDGWDPSLGGVLGIFDAPDASTPVAVVEPHHNTMSAMAMGPSSHHAVSAQHGPARYSIVWSFRTVDGRHQL